MVFLTLLDRFRLPLDLKFNLFLEMNDSIISKTPVLLINLTKKLFNLVYGFFQFWDSVWNLFQRIYKDLKKFQKITNNFKEVASHFKALWVRLILLGCPP